MSSFHAGLESELIRPTRNDCYFLVLASHRFARGGDAGEVMRWQVNTILFGNFAEAWTTGSNKMIIATDTQKNTIYQLAKVS